MVSRARILFVTTAFVFSLCATNLLGSEVITHPYLGVTHITRTETVPRSVRIHVVTIDLTLPGIRFEMTPPGGSLETIRRTTLGFLNEVRAQIAINSHFFLPFPSTNPDAMLIGLAAFNGNVYSAFEAPIQSYALVTDSPAINIDADNHAGIVHRDPLFPDAKHVVENVTLWNAVAGSAQIVTNGVKTIPTYADAQNLDGLLTPGGPASYSNTNSWYNLLNARTAIGLSHDAHTLILFSVDRAGGSLGMSVGEVADMLMHDYAVYNALNLDGGGSTSLAMEDPVSRIGALVNVSADNPAGRSVGSNLAVFAERDVIPPSTTAALTPLPTNHGWNNSDVTVALNAVDNPGGWVKQVQYSMTGAMARADQVVEGDSASQVVNVEGVTTMTYFATDFMGNEESARSLAIRIDKTLPTISGMPSDGCLLWPPNRRLERVAVVTAADTLSGVASFDVTISDNETLDANDPDVNIKPTDSGGFEIYLRAARPGAGRDRTYAITATVHDQAGNAQTARSVCTVPHDSGKPSL